jgi:type I restriction enzyme S subunit
VVTKKTEIGVLPSDWSVVTLLDCLCGKPSYGINAPAIAYSPQKPRYIRITDITEAGTYSKSSPASVEDVNIDRYYLKKNDIVLARTGASVGKSYLYQKDDGNLVYAGFLIKVSINDIVADARYVFACLHTQRYWQWVNTISVRSGQPGINGEEYSAYLLPLPSRTEQATIADAISDTDRLISSLQKLIEKKKAIKQGSMQELLTGKKRLPGFYGEWEHVKLKDIILDFIVPMRDKPKDLSGEIPWCRIEDFNGKYLSKSKSGQGVTFDTVNRMNLKIFPKETLIVSCSAYLGRCAIVKTELITNQTFIGLVAKSNISVEFLFYVMCKEEKNLNLLSSGTTISYLSREQFEEYLIYIPKDLAEQQSMAQVLSDMDSEIEQLEKKLSKYQQIKQGMMQELLTGRIRLV